MCFLVPVAVLLLALLAGILLDWTSVRRRPDTRHDVSPFDG